MDEKVNDWLIFFQIRNEMFSGLIIQEATYGATETDKDDPYVTLNVTSQLQALVRNSQLHIPGGDSRVLFCLSSLDHILISFIDSPAGFFRPYSLRTEIATHSLFIQRPCTLRGDP